MNARVFLLVLVTGLFMAAWDGDQAAMEAAIVRRDTRIANARIAMLQQETGEVQTVAVSQNDTNAALEHSLTVAQVSETTSQPASDTRTSENDDTVVPMPHSIAAGNYHAINQSTGESIRLTVGEAKASNDRQQDFYTVDGDEGDRWYLIRIDSDLATQL